MSRRYMLLPDGVHGQTQENKPVTVLQWGTCSPGSVLRVHVYACEGRREGRMAGKPASASHEPQECK